MPIGRTRLFPTAASGTASNVAVSRSVVYRDELTCDLHHHRHAVEARRKSTNVLRLGEDQQRPLPIRR